MAGGKPKSEHTTMTYLEKELLKVLPEIYFDEDELKYHEKAEVYFNEDITNMIENQYILYVEGIDYSGRKTGNEATLVGFTGIRNVKKLFGIIKIKKDSVFIPVNLITNYVPLKEK